MTYEKGLMGRLFGKQARLDRKAAKRDNLELGSAKRARVQNRINRLADSDVRHGGLMGRTKYMRGGDTADFDVSDARDVVKFQRLAGLKEDGMFGPKTAAAWRQYVNTQRAGEGKEAYFDDAVDTPVDDSVLGPGGYGEYFKKMWGGE